MVNASAAGGVGKSGVSGLRCGRRRRCRRPSAKRVFDGQNRRVWRAASWSSAAIARVARGSRRSLRNHIVHCDRRIDGGRRPGRPQAVMLRRGFSRATPRTTPATPAPRRRSAETTVRCAGRHAKHAGGLRNRAETRADERVEVGCRHRGLSRARPSRRRASQARGDGERGDQAVQASVATARCAMIDDEAPQIAATVEALARSADRARCCSQACLLQQRHRYPRSRSTTTLNGERSVIEMSQRSTSSCLPATVRRARRRRAVSRLRHRLAAAAQDADRSDAGRCDAAAGRGAVTLLVDDLAPESRRRLHQPRQRPRRAGDLDAAVADYNARTSWRRWRPTRGSSSSTAAPTSSSRRGAPTSRSPTCRRRCASGKATR